MRVRFSDHVLELLEKIEPYMFGNELKADAPDEIKKAYKEFKELANKEYEDAFS